MDQILLPSIIFSTSLLACVPTSYVYKSIENEQKRSLLATGVGILFTTGICGIGVIYTAILVTGNILIIRVTNGRYVHKVSLVYTWMCLIYIYHYTRCTRFSAWLYQIISLRLVGLAFEIYLHDKMTRPENKTASSSKNPMPVDDSVTKLTAADIATYAYFFLGLPAGPYYTWKTFNDHMKSTFGNEGNFWAVCKRKLIKAVMLMVLFVFLRSKYPISMYEDDAFYYNYGTDYRFLICIPHLLLYYLEAQIIMMLSTCACALAGLGVYPVRAQAVPGGGPTKPFEPLTEKEEFNFSMLKCFDNEKLILGPKMKDSVRGWDMPTRYWYAQYIVKNLIHNNFKVRSACSFLLWTIWAGCGIQKIIVALTLWVYIHLESDYAVLYAETLTGPWDLGFAIMRMFCLFYLTPCWVLEDKDTVLRYYNSIYWMYHIVLAVLFMAAIAVHKFRTRTRFPPDASGTSKPAEAPAKPAADISGTSKSISGDEATKPSKSEKKEKEPSTSENKGVPPVEGTKPKTDTKRDQK